MMREYTIKEMQERMAAGELTARELVRLYLERIELIDRSGPALNSIIETNPDALTIAAELDRERAEGKARGPLHGVPILVKDNIDTADRMHTSAGSLALENSIAAQDAFLVERLRAAGAILLGKANLSEWANFRSTHSVSGWSSRAGLARNPYALDRSPSGSSSGSAVAAAANLCAAAVGTETDGSIIAPSSANGVVGIKPTVGLVSRSGVIPISHNQDTAGPMARTVADAAALLAGMAGPDPRDTATAEGGSHAAEYTTFLDVNGMKGARIGVARNYFGFHPRVDALIEDCLAVMRSLGAELIDPVTIDTDKELGEVEGVVLYYDFKADLNAYLSGLGDGAAVHSLEELIQFNEKNRERVMPFFGQEHMLKAQAKGPLTEEAYVKALEKMHRLSRMDGIDAVMKKHKLDALAAPTADPAWLVDFVNGDTGGGSGCTSMPATSGYPHITVPAGLVSGMPVGISFFGAAWSEPVLIRLAYAFEQATHARRSPEYRKTAIIR
jgi:amidase